MQSETFHQKQEEDARKERQHRNFELNMKTAPGWIGGFEKSKKAFSYPDPDLTSLQVQDNRKNIGDIKRQIKVVWPEFSWQTIPGDESSRCYEMFAPDVSRLGYTNEGKVLSVICPQQGTYLDHFGAMNVEVTVTGNRGWMNEDNNADERLAGQVGVMGKIWFSPAAREYKLVKLLFQTAKRVLKDSYDFPFSKAKAICVQTHKVGDESEPLFFFKAGLSSRFTAPSWTKHPEAYQNANLSVQIGKIVPSGDKNVDKFNQMVLDIFNLGSANMLKDGNILTWNMWTDFPHKANTAEWNLHAKKWRDSIDSDHGSPGGENSKVRFGDATLYTVGRHAFEELEFILWKVSHFIKTGKIRNDKPRSVLNKFLCKGKQKFLPSYLGQRFIK